MEDEKKKMNEEKKGFIKGVFSVILFIVVATITCNIFMPSSGINSIALNGKLREIGRIINSEFIDKVDNDKLMDGIYRGMMNGISDKYATYYSREQVKELLDETNGEYAGIGVLVITDTIDNLLTVVTVFENSPAQKSGLLIGDKIIKVDGTDVVEKTSDDIVQMIKGKPHTKVVVTVYRTSSKETLDIEIERAIVDIPTVSHKMLSNNIAYIKIDAFDGKTFSQFCNSLNSFNLTKIKGLVIDVRNNPGGTLDSVLKVADIFVPKGSLITYMEDKNGKRENYFAKIDSVSIPLVVLTNGYSASASELFTGAIKDHKLGIVVGEKTYGKGVVQEVFRLKDGTAVKLTVSKYYTPSGICIDKEGIIPDVEILLPKELEYKFKIDEKEDVQLLKAIEILSNK